MTNDDDNEEYLAKVQDYIEEIGADVWIANALTDKYIEEHATARILIHLARFAKIMGISHRFCALQFTGMVIDKVHAQMMAALIDELMTGKTEQNEAFAKSPVTKIQSTRVH